MIKYVILPFLCIMILSSFRIGMGNSNYGTCKNEKYNRLASYTGLKYVHKFGCYMGEDLDG